jgi:hypothetical protein
MSFVLGIAVGVAGLYAYQNGISALTKFIPFIKK